MSAHRLSDELAQQAIDACAQYGGTYKAAAVLHLPRSTMMNRLVEARERNLTPSPHLFDKSNPKHLSETIRQLEKQLAAEQKASLDHATIRRRIIGLQKSIETLEIPDWMLDVRASTSAPGTPTLLCSDWHAGEVVKASQIGGVNRYNMDIFKARIQTLLESTIKLLRIISPKMEYPGIVVPLGGDMVSGNIHEELRTTNELETMPTVIELYGVISWMIEEMLKHFPHIFLPCVSGNHGRNTLKIWNKDRHHTNFDWLLYGFLAKRFEDNSRITFFVPDGPDAYYRVYDQRILLTHGDQFRGGDGMIGALGPIIRGDHKKRSRNAQVKMEYDIMLLGHWHQYIHLTRLIVNGSLKGYDEYAYANNFPFESPTQALWLTHPKYGITYRMPVYVDPKLRAVEKTPWVSVPRTKGGA